MCLTLMEPMCSQGDSLEVLSRSILARSCWNAPSRSCRKHCSSFSAPEGPAVHLHDTSHALVKSWARPVRTSANDERAGRAAWLRVVTTAAISGLKKLQAGANDE